MNTTVSDLFRASGISDFDSAKWDQPVKTEREGVYIVSTSDDPNQNLRTINTPEFADQILNLWIRKLLDCKKPKFTLDQCEPTIANVKKRLSTFWLPDENIIYIGKAPRRKNESTLGPLGKRIKEYYDHEIGNHGNHSGGQWIKTLKNLNSFFVYYGEVDDPGSIEQEMLKQFMSNVSQQTLHLLRDKKLPLPFANIRFRGRDKNHGFKCQKL